MYNRPRPQSSAKRYAINERIRAREVQVIDEQGKPLGTMPTLQALTLAQERGFDLVEVSPLAQPPVTKFLDFGQWQYQQTRAQGKARKVEIKTIQLSLKIGQHDIDVRRSQIEKFFAKGHKAKITLRLRGREKARQELAREIMKEFIASLGPNIIIDKPLSYQGAELSVTLGRK